MVSFLWVALAPLCHTTNS
uniref:Uncharacterized protein n=1 Tax=Rhizophora mucronata TaxID=61149 RepID=A0A2P2Q1T2_RHIMU